MLVYKYVSEIGKEIIKNGSIRFTQIDALNDPFEVKPSLDLFVKSIREYFRNEIDAEDEFKERIAHIIDNVKKIFKDYFVLSLTKKRNNLLMWSHYTNAYQGFVIGFDFENLFFNNINLNIFRAYDVEYSDKRPEFFELTELLQGQATFKDFKRMLLTKSTHWKYEKEIRMFAPPVVGNNIGKKDTNGFDIYVFDFPPECLKEIVFGHSMKPELKKEMSNIVEARYPQVELFEAQLSKTVFDLDIKEYRSRN